MKKQCDKNDRLYIIGLEQQLVGNGPDHFITEHLTTYRSDRADECLEQIRSAFEKGGMLVNSIQIEQIEDDPKTLIHLFQNLDLSTYDYPEVAGFEEPPWKIEFDGENFWITDLVAQYKTRIDFGKVTVNIDRGLH